MYIGRYTYLQVGTLDRQGSLRHHHHLFNRYDCARRAVLNSIYLAVEYPRQYGFLQLH